MNWRTEGLESPPPKKGGRAEAGFSLVEVLIAALLLLIIALGLIPLLSRAMSDNENGRDATSATNFEKSQLEAYIGMPWEATILQVPAAATVGTTTDVWTQGVPTLPGTPPDVGNPNEGWFAGTTPPASRGAIRWTRATRVRQYQAVDIKDHVLNNPLSGSADPSVVQIKEVEVQLTSAKQISILGGGPDVTFRVLKVF